MAGVAILAATPLITAMAVDQRSDPTPPGRSDVTTPTRPPTPGATAPGRSPSSNVDETEAATPTTTVGDRSPAATAPGRSDQNPGGTGGGQPTTGPGRGPTDSESEAEDGPTRRYVVQFVRGASPAAEAPGLERDGAGVQRLLQRVFSGAVVDLGPAGLERVRRNPRVALVEPDIAVTTFSTQTNPPWGLDRVDQAQLPLSGTFTSSAQGSGVRSYVVDTGVRPDHVEFAGRVITGMTSIDDGRGTADCNGHGTHVAGTIAGETYGVAKRATVVPVRVLGCDGSGTMSGVIAGLDWILSQHPAGSPGVVNMSLGGGVSSLLDTAVARVAAAGLIVVAAAGNSGSDACFTSPARVPVALTVGAVSRSDTKASWSNYGTCLDLFAPGVDITSAWPNSSTGTAAISGTSMAAPHVAGVAAVVWSMLPGAGASSVQGRLVSEATTGVVVSGGPGSPNRLLRLMDDGSDPTTTTSTSTSTTTTTTSTPPSTTTTTSSPDTTSTSTSTSLVDGTTTTTPRSPGQIGRDRSNSATPPGRDQDRVPPGLDSRSDGDNVPVVPPGLSIAAGRVAESAAPEPVRNRVVARLVEIGQRLGATTSATVVVIDLVANTIEASPLPEPVREALTLRVRDVTSRLMPTAPRDDDGLQTPSSLTPPSDRSSELAEVADVIELYRDQRVTTAAAEIEAFLARLETRAGELLGSQNPTVTQRLADLRSDLAQVADLDGLRRVIAAVRQLADTIAQLATTESGN